MKDNKNLNPIGELKAQLNTPKTETRIVLNDWQTEAKKSKLSPVARAKVVNHNKPYQSQNQEGYGPCSYYGCDHKGVPFDLTIGIQGCKWWARGPNSGTSLPGYWEQSPTGSYYWKEQLWLNHIGHAYEANSLMGPRLYTVNTAGLCAVEDERFCRDARKLISECIEAHRDDGNAINTTKTISSCTTGATKWGIKAGLALANLNPATAIIGGGATWLISKGLESSGNKVLDSVTNISADVGSSTFWGGVVGGTLDTASTSVASMGTKLIGHEAAREIAINGGAITNVAETLIFTGRTISIGQKVYKIYDAFDTYKRPIIDAAKHQTHVLQGTSYCYDCSICSGK